MPAIKVLANLFASLQNSEMRHKKECIVIPASSLAGEDLTVLQKRRYIGEFELLRDGVDGKLKIQLLGRINRCAVISPMVTLKKRALVAREHSLLPAGRVGGLDVSTPSGVTERN